MPHGGARRGTAGARAVVAHARRRTRRRAAGRACRSRSCAASSTRSSPSTRRRSRSPILRLIELEKSVVEGAGAAPLAAFLAGKLDALEGQATSCWCCAAATSTSRSLDRVIEVGLVADGRLVALHRVDQRSARRPRAPRRSHRVDRRIDQGDRPRPRVLGPGPVRGARRVRRRDDGPRARGAACIARSPTPR